MAFYEAAGREHTDEARRWELWQKIYGFAAVPPTPQGEAMVAELVMTHEFTHVVEAEEAGLSLDWKRAVAHTIFYRGASDASGGAAASGAGGTGSMWGSSRRP